MPATTMYRRYLLAAAGSMPIRVDAIGILSKDNFIANDVFRLEARYTDCAIVACRCDPLAVVDVGRVMSTEIVCDHCGKRSEPGVATVEWWEVSQTGEALDLDFCSPVCAGAFFTAAAEQIAPPPQHRRHIAHAVTTDGIP